MEIFSRCGMRCDLCLIYRPNVEANDRRAEICRVWTKIFPGFSQEPSAVICDGCQCDEPNAVLFDRNCKVRSCVIDKNITHCGQCDEYPCSLFPAEPTQEELHQKIDVEHQWTWDEEALMAAYRCKRHMDEYRKQNGL